MAIPATFPVLSYVTSYANPGGVGNRSALITVTSTFTAGSSSAADLVNGADAGDTYTVADGQSVGEWRFDFGAGSRKYIDEFTWYQNLNVAEGTYTLEGSMDGNAWSPVLETFTLGLKPIQVTKFQPLTSDAYQIFRLRLTGGTTSAAPWLNQIEFKIADFGSAIPCPDCDFQSNNSVAFTIDENEFGDGYSQRSASGINNTRDSWSASWTNVTSREKDTIVNFIRAQKGFSSFNWVAPGDSVSHRWTARDLKIQPVDAGIWTLTSTIRMEFDL